MRTNYKLLILLAFAAACGDPGAGLTTAGYDCADIPRPGNAKLPLSDAADDWYRVYESAAGVYSIVEPYQVQETVSHLIVGAERALLFDSGIGLVPLRPVIERITDLPVTVLNSHTHYDHVGANWEFDSVLAVDTDYTRANMAGFDHDTIAIDFVPEAFCRGVPHGVDIATFHTRPWHADRFVSDGELLDLGGRRLEVLHVPGHTPDSLALLDRPNRLLFTGDTWYDASLWLFVRETNLGDYASSIARLAALEHEVDYLFGAHNSARHASGVLQAVKHAVAEMQRGAATGTIDELGRIAFEIDGVRILTSPQALEGRQGDTGDGGSGLDTWPAAGTD